MWASARRRAERRAPAGTGVPLAHGVAGAVVQCTGARPQNGRPTLNTTPDILALYDADERFRASYPGTRREELPALVRHVDLLGTTSSVIYSRLSSSRVDAAIEAQIAYFSALGHDFEWKAYAHDQPPDLIEHLARHGFAVDEREAILVLDLPASTPISTEPAHVRQITRRDELRDVAAVRDRVYPTRNADAMVARLAYELEHTPDGIAIYVAERDGAPAACAWIRFPDSSAFASLWGGATVPELRQRGLYTDLLAVRIQAARRRGFRYLTVDARSTSRPILEKRGFQVLTFATACTFSDVIRLPR